MANRETPPQVTASETRDRISDVEKVVFDLLVPTHKANAIKPKDFKERYSAEEIERDLASVERKKSKFLRENPERKKRADILEAILSEQIELSNWFGENVLTIVPSEYDNFFYAADMAAEFEQEGEFQYLTLGIDITSSPGSVEKKIRKIKEGIRIGRLTEIKYFSSERNPSPDFPGPLRQLPNVIIGVDQRTIIELSEIWLQIFKAREMKNKERDPKIQSLYATDTKTAKDRLAHHRVQLLILRELEIQLETFANFANEAKQPDIAKKYQDLLKLIRDILKTKSISKDSEKTNVADDVYAAIETCMENFDSL